MKIQDRISNSMVSAIVEDTDIGQVSFYDSKGKYVDGINGRGEPQAVDDMREYLEGNWLEVDRHHDLIAFKR